MVGMVFMKTPVQPVQAVVRAGRESYVPRKRVAPAVWRAREAGEEGSRTRAWMLTGEVWERSARAVAPPWEPVAPVMRIVGGGMVVEELGLGYMISLKDRSKI